MTFSISPKTSTTTGLLTASAIYIGLLAYANYYAFENGKDPDNAEIALKNENKAIDRVAGVVPLTQGIFNSEVFTDIEQSAALKSKQTGAALPGSESASSLKINELDSPIKTTQRLNTVPTVQILESLPPGFNANNEQLYFFQNGRNHANLAHYQNMNHQADYYGQGRGKGSANGDGEFSFTMNFKSRASMDADSDIDGDLSGTMHTYHNQYGYMNSAMHPAYRGYYRQY